ncbi:hCG2038825, isoform CRA_a [Homo sapiens]
MSSEENKCVEQPQPPPPEEPGAPAPSPPAADKRPRGRPRKALPLSREPERNSAHLHPGEINSFIAHTKPVWWSLHTDAHEIWCRDLDRGTSLRRSIPCPPALCSVRKIHLRPQVLRPTSPRNISPISNLIYSA